MAGAFESLSLLAEPAVCPAGSSLERVFAFPSTSVVSIILSITAFIFLVIIANYANSIVLLSLRYRDATTSSGPLLIYFIFCCITALLEAYRYSYPAVESGRVRDVSNPAVSTLFSVASSMALGWVICHQHRYRVVGTPTAGIISTDKPQREVRFATVENVVTTALSGVIGLLLFVSWYLPAGMVFHAMMLVVLSFWVLLKLWTVFLAVRMAVTARRLRRCTGRGILMRYRYELFAGLVALVALTHWPVWTLAGVFRGCAGALAGTDIPLLLTLLCWAGVAVFTLVEFRRASADLSWHALTQLNSAAPA